MRLSRAVASKMDFIYRPALPIWKCAMRNPSVCRKRGDHWHYEQISNRHIFSAASSCIAALKRILYAHKSIWIFKQTMMAVSRPRRICSLLDREIFVEKIKTIVCSLFHDVSIHSFRVGSSPVVWRGDLTTRNPLQYPLTPNGKTMLD